MIQFEELRLQAKAVGFNFFSLLFCKYILFWGTLAGFVGGMYFLITNVIAFQNELATLILCIVLVLGTVFISLFMAWRHQPSPDRIITLLDRVNNGGGMLLSASELIDSGWKEELTINELPVIKLRSPKSIVIFIAALLFVFGAYLAPPAVKAAIGSTHMDIKNETQTLSEQLQVLEEEKIITQKEAANLREQMEKMEKNAAGEDPVKTWEALDHMKESISSKAQEFAEKTARQTEALTLSQKALEALKQARDKASPSEYNVAMEEMAQLMQKLVENSPKLSEKLSKELKDMLKESKLSMDGLEQLLNSQQLTQKQLEALLKKLKERGLCNNPGKKSQCNSGQGGETTMVTRENFEELMKMLDEESKGKKGKCSITSLMMVCFGGKGGVNRGRGDAPMTWSDKEINRDNVKFKALTLPADGLSSLKRSKLLGVSYGAATAQPDAEISTGHLSGVKVKGTKTNRFILMPKHRTLIKKYFNKN
jgi:hypothetical protein